MNRLEALYAAHRGKLSDKWSSYLREYDRIFSPRRGQPLRILEIGIQNGGSLELWSQYFEHATCIVGCDIDERCRGLRYDDERIAVVVADAGTDLAERQILAHASSFDIIIDDGSHRSSDIIAAFARYFPHLADGGCFVIEDLHCSYWQEFEGGLADPDSAQSFLKLLVDIVNHEAWGIAKTRSGLLQGLVDRYGVRFDEAALEMVHSVEFLNSLCVITKAEPSRNGLGSRRIVGTATPVEAAPLQMDGTNLEVPDQSENPWAVREVPSRAMVVAHAEQLSQYQGQLRQYRNNAAQKEREISRLELEAKDSRQALQAAQHQAQASVRENAELKRDLQNRLHELENLSGALRSIQNSLSWRAAAPLRSMERRLERRRSRRRRSTTITALQGTGLFDPVYYAEQYPDVIAAGIDPLVHYVSVGAAEGRNPNSSFDTAYYLRTNPDVAMVGMNPLLHYAMHGAAEGRAASARESEPPCAAGGEDFVQYRIDVNGSFTGADDVLVYVAYCPDGVLSPLQRQCIEGFANEGYRVVLVVNSGAFNHMVWPGTVPVAVQIVRENVGFDFGAWAHALRLVSGLEAVRSVSFTNDSVIGPLRPENSPGLRERVDGVNAAAVFMTECHEIEPHFQSYFFTLKKEALGAGGLDAVRASRCHGDKDAVIFQEEVKLWARLRDGGMAVAAAFPLPQADVEKRNPTIHYWRELLDEGFPFVKVMLVSAGLLAIDTPALAAALGPEVIERLQQHLAQRSTQARARPADPNQAPRPALRCPARFAASNHALQACNPAAASMPPLAVPLGGSAAANFQPSTSAPVLVIVHCFYIDEAEKILENLARVQIPLRLLLTTDTVDKALQLEALLLRFKLTGEVAVAQNRGRDVAPFLIEGKKYLGDAEFVLHLHTKKSPHDSVYAGWSEFLRKNLIGSGSIVRSILGLLAREEIGIVYSDHYEPVRNLRNWGHDHGRAARLMARLGIALSSDFLLEFPTSTMFWARVEAIRPLFDLDFDYEDFEPEAGQVDGTLAHAIERCLLYVVERQGYRHLKVLAVAGHESADVLSTSHKDIDYMLRRHAPRLLGSTGPRSLFNASVAEVYPVEMATSKDRSPRFNVIVPTLNPTKIYGGIATALHCARKILESLEEAVDIRLIVTSDAVDAESLREASARMGATFTLSEPNYDTSGSVVVDLCSRRYLPLTLRAGDMLFATAWWTADLAFRLRDHQVQAFGNAPDVVYLIQDYEPSFYAWSNKYALALATYARGVETIALVNSEELSNFITARHALPCVFHVPYDINPVLRSRLQACVKQKKIIVYGRPSVARNLFGLIVEGLRVWQGTNPEAHCIFELVFAGEPFDEAQISELENARTVGKLSLEEYAQLLNESAIGIALMMSPHPSYPPLEMAAAGCQVITNAYEFKDLTRRAPNILSLEAVTPQALAAALDVAVASVRWGFAAPLVEISHIPTAVPEIDYRRVAGLLRPVQ